MSSQPQPEPYGASPTPQPPTGSGETVGATSAPPSGGGESGGEPGYVREIQSLRARAQQAEEKARHYEGTLQQLGPLMTEAQGELTKLGREASEARIAKQQAEIALAQLQSKSQEYGFEVDDREIRRLQDDHRRATELETLLSRQSELMSQQFQQFSQRFEQMQHQLTTQQTESQRASAFESEVERQLKAAEVPGPTAQHLKAMAMASWQVGGKQQSAESLLQPILANFRVTQAHQAATNQAHVTAAPPTQQGGAGSTVAPATAEIRIKDAPPEIRAASPAVQMEWARRQRAAAAAGAQG